MLKLFSLNFKQKIKKGNSHLFQISWCFKGVKAQFLLWGTVLGYLLNNAGIRIPARNVSSVVINHPSYHFSTRTTSSLRKGNKSDFSVQVKWTGKGGGLPDSLPSTTSELLVSYTDCA